MQFSVSLDHTFLANAIFKLRALTKVKITVQQKHVVWFWRHQTSTTGAAAALLALWKPTVVGSLTSGQCNRAPGVQAVRRDVQAVLQYVAAQSADTLPSQQSHSHSLCLSSLIHCSRGSAPRTDSQKWSSLWVLVLWTCGSCTDS